MRQKINTPSPLWHLPLLTKIIATTIQNLVSNMQKITSAILNDSKIHNSLVIGRVRNHALPVANAIKQVGLPTRHKQK